MARPLVLLALRVADAAAARIEAECAIRRHEGGGLPSKAELRAAIGDVEGVLTSTRVAFDAETLAAAPRLRVISNFGVGYDNVDLEAATLAGVIVCNTPAVLTDAVADLTMGLIISLARRLPEAERLVREGSWAKGSALLGSDLTGKTLGIVGLGRIGCAVARRAQAFGMAVSFCDEFSVPPEDVSFCTNCDFEGLLASADFVTLHVNLTNATRGLIGARELALMKPTAYLINTSRGQVVDQAALVEALTAGHIAGAALDVLEREPPAPRDPVLRAPNVILLPHIGSATTETRQAMLDLAIDNLLAALRGDRPQYVVNPEALPMSRRQV
jgi:phosphoglycerate dehydrogenase-like enzyme